MIPLPSTWGMTAAGCTLASCLGFAGGMWLDHTRMEAKLADLRAEHAGQVAQAEHRIALAEAEQRTEETRRAAAQQETDHVASLARARADDDRRSADAAHLRLLNAARAAAARASGASADTAAAASCETAPSAGPVLAILLERADDVAGELAAALDQSRAAGLGCERYVDALTAGQ